MKYNQKLPKKIEKQLDAYIERIKVIKWLSPSTNLKKKVVDSTVNLALKGFGVEASIEYRKLSTSQDWGAARDAAWDAAWSAAWDAAWGAARDAARGAARGAAWGACEILVSNLKEYKGKLAFLTLIDLWELGLYPVGIIDKKFVVYVPASNQDFPEDLLK